MFMSWVTSSARLSAGVAVLAALAGDGRCQVPVQPLVPAYGVGYPSVAYRLAPVASYNPVGFGFGGYSYGGYPAYGYNGNLPAAYEGFTGYGHAGGVSPGYGGATVVGYRGMTTIVSPSGYSYYNMSDTWAAVCGPNGCRVVYRSW
jgi:hypothetical protein